jgi:hypothetical protein
MSAQDNVNPNQFSWDQVRGMHPDYAGAEDLVTYAAYATPDDPEAEDAHPYDLNFTRRQVDVGHHGEPVHIPRALYSDRASDPRVVSAREGYARGEDVPPVLAIERNRKLYFADGNHRAIAARGLSGAPERWGHFGIDAYVAKSPERRRVPDDLRKSGMPNSRPRQPRRDPEAG